MRTEGVLFPGIVEAFIDTWGSVATHPPAKNFCANETAKCKMCSFSVLLFKIVLLRDFDLQIKNKGLQERLQEQFRSSDFNLTPRVHFWGRWSGAMWKKVLGPKGPKSRTPKSPNTKGVRHSKNVGKLSIYSTGPKFRQVFAKSARIWRISFVLTFW